ncbi:MAG: hypothetical protein ACRENE_10965 [Polyangiaceae bacterium]
MPRKPRADRESIAGITIGVRVTAAEREQLLALIARKETAADLAPGTLTAAGYIRSLVVKHLADESKRKK